MNRLYDWILLDLDNTIFDFNTSSHLAFHSFLEDYKISTDNGYYQVYKKLNKEIWQQLEHGQLTSDEVKWKRFKNFFDYVNRDEDPHKANECYLSHLVDHFRFVNGAQDVIHYLSGKYHLGVVTNGLKNVQRARLERSGISDLFKVIVISEEIGHAKPQNEYFEVVFKRMNYPDKDRVLIVGDNISSDIKGGIDYGIDTCWYNHDGIENNSNLKPQYEIDQLKFLIDVL
ncbi:MAG: noncanonical pyrimidine nucleotidase, YjjG family [Saprospiraceae bacterium]|nr:noncanonical pyrimidine nucleotidase, YjjG family [Saprospiraceae bacterium]